MQKIIADKGVRHGDVSVTSNADGSVVTITVGEGDDHDHLEMTSNQAVRLANALAVLTDWTAGGGV